MDLSSYLKQTREEYKFSQEEIAKELNVSKQSVSKWEEGNCYPDLDNLIKLSDIYNISLDELIREDKEFQKKIIIKDTNNPWSLNKSFENPVIIMFLPILSMLTMLIMMALIKYISE